MWIKTRGKDGGVMGGTGGRTFQAEVPSCADVLKQKRAGCSKAPGWLEEGSEGERRRRFMQGGDGADCAGLMYLGRTWAFALIEVGAMEGS